MTNIEKIREALEAYRAFIPQDGDKCPCLGCAALDALAAVEREAGAKPEAPKMEPSATFDRMFLDVWRCSYCGEMRGNQANPAWRWNGEAWEHKCPGSDPQAGYEIARNFGRPDAAAIELCEELWQANEECDLLRCNANKVDSALPVTFFALLPLHERVKRMAEQWNRAIMVNQELEAQVDRQQKEIDVLDAYYCAAEAFMQPNAKEGRTLAANVAKARAAIVAREAQEREKEHRILTGDLPRRPVSDG